MNELMKIEFTPDQVKLIKSQVAPLATDDELKLFLYQCQRTGLDPLTRQIYAIHRKVRNADGSYSNKMTIQTSIDGFRVIAERSGLYAGQDEPVFERNENGQIVCAKVTVYRFAPNGTRYPAATGVAYWNEYVPLYQGKPTGLWAKAPHTMISKVAEAQSLRRAFSQDLSGLYTGDELEQADEDKVKPEVKVEPVVEERKSLNDAEPLVLIGGVNQNTFGTKEKPLITNLGFKKAMELAAYDPSIYEKTKKKYSLHPDQERLLKNEYYQKNINK